MIEINPGINRQRAGEFIWFWLEAHVFEDMCALFNQAKEIERGLNRSTIGKKEHKTYYSLLRATVLTAFHFVEAYLNGLAFDHCATQHKKINEEIWPSFLTGIQKPRNQSILLFGIKCFDTPRSFWVWSTHRYKKVIVLTPIFD